VRYIDFMHMLNGCQRKTRRSHIKSFPEIIHLQIVRAYKHLTIIQLTDFRKDGKSLRTQIPYHKIKLNSVAWVRERTRYTCLKFWWCIRFETNISMNVIIVWDTAPCSPYGNRSLRERITFIFRVENEPSKKAACRRWPHGARKIYLIRM
jgi:hypothetical protein